MPQHRKTEIKRALKNKFNKEFENILLIIEPIVAVMQPLTLFLDKG